jgi:hypothetical protein
VQEEKKVSVKVEVRKRIKIACGILYLTYYNGIFFLEGYG